jgi:hypothetical protein
MTLSFNDALISDLLLQKGTIMLASSLRWSHRVLSTCSSTMSCSLMQARTLATSPPDDVPGSPHEADKFRFKKRTIFPMCLPTNDQKASDPSVLFNAFRAETLHQMKVPSFSYTLFCIIWELPRFRDE